jgi:glyoxylase-like metal-dependent hydrolase (beta-lactamase superfamily II)
MELTPNLHAFVWTAAGANNCNTYLLRAAEKNILVDPGHAALFDHVRRGLASLGLVPEDIDLIIGTHAHPDHIEAVRLFARPPALCTLHAAEWQLVEEAAPHLRAALNFDPEGLTPDFFLTEGELTVGDIDLQVFHTPGHAPGAVTLFWPQERALLTGDLIFRGGLGRADLPGGDGRKLKESIRRMATLDVDWLLPGHGDIIRGAETVQENFAGVERTWFDYI